jgi:hypothetical protein
LFAKAKEGCGKTDNKTSTSELKKTKRPELDQIRFSFD